MGQLIDLFTNNANFASSAATPDQPLLETVPPPGGLGKLWLWLPSKPEYLSISFWAEPLVNLIEVNALLNWILDDFDFWVAQLWTLCNLIFRFISDFKLLPWELLQILKCPSWRSELKIKVDLGLFVQYLFRYRWRMFMVQFIAWLTQICELIENSWEGSMSNLCRGGSRRAFDGGVARLLTFGFSIREDALEASPVRRGWKVTLVKRSFCLVSSVFF